MRNEHASGICNSCNYDFGMDLIHHQQDGEDCLYHQSVAMRNKKEELRPLILEILKEEGYEK